MGKPFDYNPVAQNYSCTRFTVPWVLAPLQEQILLMQYNSNILEIGCGTGNYIIELSLNIPNNDYFGFDISEEMLKVAASRSKKVNFVKGDAENIFPYETSILDLCFAVDVIHHIVNIENFFMQVARCLKQKGIFVLVTDLEENMRKRSLSKFFPEILKVEMDRYPSLDLILKSGEDAGMNFCGLSLAEGFQDIDDEFIERHKSKCSSSQRLITVEQHKKGIERMIKAKDSGEKWFSSYSVLIFEK